MNQPPPTAVTPLGSGPLSGIGEQPSTPAVIVSSLVFRVIHAFKESRYAAWPTGELSDQKLAGFIIPSTTQMKTGWPKSPSLSVKHTVLDPAETLGTNINPTTSALINPTIAFLTFHPPRTTTKAEGHRQLETNRFVSKTIVTSDTNGKQALPRKRSQ